MPEKTIHISLKTIVYVILLCLGLYTAFLAKEIIMSLFLAIILMAALNPAVLWLERRKVPRTLAIAMLYVLLVGLIAGVITLVVPPLVYELSNLVNTFKVPQLPQFLQSFDFSVRDISGFLAQIGSSLSSVVGVVVSTFSSLFFILTLFVMSFYLLLARKDIVEKILWFPHSQKSERLLTEFIDKMELDLGSWVRGQFFLMLTIGCITFVFLTILGIPYALPLAVLAGLLEILPNLGPTLAAIPAILIAFLFVSPSMALVVTVMYIVIQQLENNVLVPRIMKAAVNVEPITSMVFILAGLKLGGVMGALLSIPIYIVVRSAAVIYFREQESK